MRTLLTYFAIFVWIIIYSYISEAVFPRTLLSYIIEVILLTFTVFLIIFIIWRNKLVNKWKDKGDWVKFFKVQRLIHESTEKLKWSWTEERRSERDDAPLFSLIYFKVIQYSLIIYWDSEQSSILRKDRIMKLNRFHV